MDSSPPRRRPMTDASPPRRSAQDSSPPRRKPMTDVSPPRRAAADSSPPRRRADVDSSPPRRKLTDSSPPRRRTHETIEVSAPRKRQHETIDVSPPRRGSSPAKEKTLTGISTGLLKASDLDQELREKQHRERKAFASRSATDTGQGAETIFRDRKGRVQVKTFCGSSCWFVWACDWKCF